VTAKGLEWNKMFTDGVCAKRIKIYEMKQTEKNSQNMFFKIHDKQGNIREKGGKNRCKMRLNMC